MMHPASDTARKVRLIMELRRAGIADARVLGAIEETPRELFVDEALQDRAYDNVALPIGSQTFGWIPLWAVDQQSGAVTFCTAHLTIKGIEHIWCTPVVTRK